MSMVRSFKFFDADGHLSLVDERHWAIARDRVLHAFVEFTQVFTFADIHRQAVPFQCFCKVEPGQVIARVAGDGDIVVVEQKLHVDILSDGQTCGFGIIAFHLRTI